MSGLRAPIHQPGWRAGGTVLLAVLACGVGAYGAERMVLGEYFTMIG
ncbi:MAG: hypothetical protein KA383_17850 [Phycisphaerae bacterium]|nr:hypothetical protein [Phycisphaerae bacterium]